MGFEVRDIRQISGRFTIRTAGFGGWPPYNVSEPKTVGPDGGYPATQTLSRWQISAGYPVIKDLGTDFSWVLGFAITHLRVGTLIIQIPNKFCYHFTTYKTRFSEGGYLADIRPPGESSGWIFRDVMDAKTTKNLFLSDIFRLFSNFQQNSHHLMFLNENH